MPPPPPLFVAPAPVARKRQRDTEDPVSLTGITASMGMHFFISNILRVIPRTCLLHVAASPPMEEWRPV